MLEPRARTVDPIILMESLFRLTELESRIPMNVNVLAGGKVPKVLSLAECLREWLDHRREVLVRRSRHRLAAIDKRLEILRRLADRLSRPRPRHQDHPRGGRAEAGADARSSSSATMQANAILDTRLRSLRKLEEMELKREQTNCRTRRRQIEDLLGSEKAQWKTVAWEIREVRKTFGPDTALGSRRTTFAEAPDTSDIDFAEAMVEREPITVIVSEKGWIRAMKGHHAGPLRRAVQGRRRAARRRSSPRPRRRSSWWRRTAASSPSTPSKLPGGRGFGDPIRLMVDLEEGADFIAAFPYRPGAKLLVVGSDGRGFVVPTDEIDGQHPQGQADPQPRRAGKGRRLRRGRGRPRRHHRREPQAPDLPARRRCRR